MKPSKTTPWTQGTSCDQRLEHISGTHHAQILRVPFRDDNGILQHWVSRHALKFYNISDT